MRTVRNITIAVDPELYRQTRCLAAEYNTSITGMVRYLLGVLPEALKAARVPGGRPQFGIAAARARAAAAALAAKQPAPQISTCTPTVSPTNPLPVNHLSLPERVSSPNPPVKL
jgi:hypothetical protein